MKIHPFSLTDGPIENTVLEAFSEDPEHTLVLAFGDPYLPRIQGSLARLRDAYPGALFLGCSTAGEIVGDSVRDGTLSGAVVKFESTSIRSALGRVPNAESSFRAGRELAEHLIGAELRCVLVLSDGLQVNGSELVRGINSVLGSGVVVTGGLAADGDRFKSTWVLLGDQVLEGVVAGVGFYGGIRVGHGSRGGWDIFGPERIITKSMGNILYELDGRPALALYKHYLGDLAKGLPGAALHFPLSIRSAVGAEPPVVRTVLAVDEAAQSLTFAGDVPEGNLAQLMQANFDRLVDGASLAATNAARIDRSSGDVLSIAISCVGRRLVLGERVEDELEAALSALPKGTHQIGFYSYGELSPTASGRCELHNQTMTMTTMWEDA